MLFFAQKHASYRTAGPIPHTVTPYEEFFSWGSHHHCLMEVSAYGDTVLLFHVQVRQKFSTAFA